jgi:hypothetical protein
VDILQCAGQLASSNAVRELNADLSVRVHQLELRKAVCLLLQNSGVPRKLRRFLEVAFPPCLQKLLGFPNGELAPAQLPLDAWATSHPLTPASQSFLRRLIPGFLPLLPPPARAPSGIPVFVIARSAG